MFMGDTTTLNNVHDFNDQKLLSESVYDHVDSIYLLKTTFQAPTYHLILDGRIKFIQRVKFIRDDLYLLKFVLQDHTADMLVYISFLVFASLPPSHVLLTLLPFFHLFAICYNNLDKLSNAIQFIFVYKFLDSEIQLLAEISQLTFR